MRTLDDGTVYLDYRGGKLVHVCGACGSICPDISKEYRRFIARHPVKCTRHKRFHAAIGAGVRCVSSKDPVEKVKL